MPASAEFLGDSVHIYHVVAPEADLVLAVYGVQEQGHFGAGDFPQGVDDVAQVHRRHVEFLHLFGRHVGVYYAALQGELAVLQHEPGHQRLLVSAGVVGLVHDAGEIDTLVDKGTHDFHGPLARVAELECSRVVDDSEIEAFCGALADFARVQLFKKHLTGGTGTWLHDVQAAEIFRVADVVVDVAGFLGAL